jgi:uncharacterized membrane protein (UPF0136 family)
MYKTAEEEINRGLSPVARSILGFFSGLFGIGMILMAPPDDNAIFFYAFGVFCLLIGAACITRGRARQFFGSIIGCLLFGLSAWYLYSQLTTGIFLSERRSEPSVIGSIFFFLAFGIPGITYAIKAKFGIARNELQSHDR